MPELGGYYWDPFVPHVTITRAGVNELNEAIALTVIPSYLSFAEMWIFGELVISWTQVGGSPVDSGPGILLGGNMLGVSSNIAAPAGWIMSWTSGERLIEMVTPANTVTLAIARPTNFMGFPTGTLNWSLTYEISGILYMRGTLDDALYT